MNTRTTTPLGWTAVIAGQRCLGHIVARGPLGYEAFDRDDRSLGVFDKRAAAAGAVEAASIVGVSANAE
jgi:hypothetical protein